MKYTKWFAGRMVGCLVAVAVVAGAVSAQAASTHDGWAKARYVVGHPEFSKAGGSWQKLERYMVLRPGDAVRCDGSSHADLLLGYNNGSVQVTPNSELLLKKLTFTYTGFEVIHETELSLKTGLTYSQVNKLANGSKYNIETPKGIAGVKGTRQAVWANGNVTVTEGSVLMSMGPPCGVVCVDAGKTLEAATCTLRAATPEEIEAVNKGTVDAMSHGGYTSFNELDSDTRKYFHEARQDPFVSPILPLE